MKNRLAALGEWIDSRTGLPSAIRNFLYEEITELTGGRLIR